MKVELKDKKFIKKIKSCYFQSYYFTSKNYDTVLFICPLINVSVVYYPVTKIEETCRGKWKLQKCEHHYYQLRETIRLITIKNFLIK